MKTIAFILLAFWLIPASKACATPQTSDLIIIKKDTFALYSLPLERYLEEKNIASEIFEKYGFSTGCYRNYQAIWNIRNDSLFLVDLISCSSSETTIPLSLIFGRDTVQKHIFAYWVADTLWAEVGNAVLYRHEGWGWYYDKEKSFIVRKGIVKDIKEYNYSDKIYIAEIDQPQNFSIKDYCCKNINWDKIPVPQKEKKVTVCLREDTCYVIKKDEDAEQAIVEEALRLTRTIKLSTVYIYGKKIKPGYFIQIVFSKEIKDNCGN